MLLPIKFEHLKNLEFPVFSLPGDDVTYEDGLLFYEGRYVIDDKNQPGKTLGMRRLSTKHKPLLKLKLSYMDPLAMILSGKKYFIDNLGRAYEYVKTKFIRIKQHKLLRVIPRDSVSLVKCSNITHLFPVRRPPPESASWCFVAYLGNYPWEIVGFSEEPMKDTRRKV